MKIHLIAIGGAVMHNLALALQQSGHLVTGSDDEIFEPSYSRLHAKGLLPHTFGWHPEKLRPDVDAVILGMHARADNPELLRAQELGLPVFSFPDFVYRQSLEANRIAICGSHGKTTITSMIMHALRSNNRTFDYLVGAQLDGFDTMVQFSNAPIMVIEGDEYFASALDRSPKFLRYQPQIALISGIAWDHFNVFPTYDAYIHQFRLLAEQMEPDGILMPCAADSELMRLLDDWEVQCAVMPYSTLTYHMEKGATFVSAEGAAYRVGVFGHHNLTNMAGAMQICTQLGITTHEFLSSMLHFKGAARRLEVLYQQNERTIYRDFAHAPSKVSATVQAVAELHPGQALTAVLELHTFSSLNKGFLPQYKGSLTAAKQKIVFYDPHTLAMKKLPAISDEEIRRYFAEPDVIVFTDPMILFSYILDLQPALLLLMSSGNFGNLNIDGLM